MKEFCPISWEEVRMLLSAFYCSEGKEITCICQLCLILFFIRCIGVDINPVKKKEKKNYKPLIFHKFNFFNRLPSLCLNVIAVLRFLQVWRLQNIDRLLPRLILDSWLVHYLQTNHSIISFLIHLTKTVSLIPPI